MMILYILKQFSKLTFENIKFGIFKEVIMRLKVKVSPLQKFLVMATAIMFMFGCTKYINMNETNSFIESKFDFERRLVELNIQLVSPGAPVANFVHSVRSGNLVFLAGHGPRRPDGTWVQGKLGRDMSIEEGYEAARLTTVNLLSSLKAEIGDLNKVKRIVKVHGMVNSDESFTDQPLVMNGCSDLLVKVFGERGRHARAAVGMVSLPFGIPVEIEMVVEIEK
jgi:enamine deaminase RidA (YjgF/YER057c/UK114 family)